MDYTRPIYGIDKELSCLCLRLNTTGEIGDSMKEDDNKECSVCEWFELEPSKTVCVVVHIV